MEVYKLIKAALSFFEDGIGDYENLYNQQLRSIIDYFENLYPNLDSSMELFPSLPSESSRDEILNSLEPTEVLDLLSQYNRFIDKKDFLKNFAEFILEDNLSEDATILDALEMFESYSEYEYQDYIDIER